MSGTAANVILNAQHQFLGGEIFATPGSDWERVKRGLEILRERRPHSTMLPCRTLKLGAIAEDWDHVRSTLIEMNYQYDPRQWRRSWSAEFFDLLLRLEALGILPPHD